MSALPHATLLCPNCYRDFRVAVWRIIPQAVVECSHCRMATRFDAANAEHRQLMDAARMTSRRQKDRIEALKTRLTPPTAEKTPPRDELEEIVRRLRQLLDEDAYPTKRRG